jgi:hypothetical protein
LTVTPAADIPHRVTKRLNLLIPSWILRQRVYLTCQNNTDKDKSTIIIIEGHYPDNTEISCTPFQSIQVTIGDNLFDFLYVNVRNVPKGEQF